MDVCEVSRCGSRAASARVERVTASWHAGCSNTVLNADGLSCGGVAPAVPNPYQGFTNVNVYCFAAAGSGFANTGYNRGRTSDPNIFYDRFGDGGSFTKQSGSFQFVSAQVTSANLATTTVTFTFTALDGTPTAGTVGINDQGPTLVTAASLGLPADAFFTGFSFDDTSQGSTQVVLDDITAGKRCFDGSQNACKIHASDDSSLTRPRLSRVLPVVDKEYSAVGLV